MSGENKLLHLVTIAVFAAGVVAVGYTELRKWYKPAPKQGREIAVELHGVKSSDEVRASMKQDRTFWYSANSKQQESAENEKKGLTGMLQRMAP